MLDPRLSANLEGPSAAYWNDFYSAAGAPEVPSAFARFLVECCAEPGFLLDLGCGNGRDSAFFAGLGWNVRGLDVSCAAIAHCRGRATAMAVAERAIFAQGAVDDPATWAGFGRMAGPVIVYARFLLHAIDEACEDALLAQSAALLQQSRGVFAAEFRTPADAALPKQAQPHYRRFVDPDRICAKLSDLGLAIEYRAEGQGMAVCGSEDAHVARILARP
jgi:SAM-dependent methyltransferase